MADHIGTVCFDLDGTLIDAVQDLASATNAAMDSMGRAPVSVQQVGDWVGNGLARLLHRALSDDMHIDADPQLHSRAMGLFRRAYADSPHDGTKVFDGATELLEVLRQRGVMVAVTTNKPHDLACSVLAALREALPVDAVFGAEHDWPRKPDPDMLHAAQAAGGGRPMVLVGDSVTDRDAAMNAGVPFLAVRGGFNHGNDIADMVEEASMVFDDLHAVRHWFEART